MLTRDTLLAGWPEPAEVRETHVSLVVLAGDRAFKFKKAVRYSFLDLTDPQRRLELCREELRLNRVLCPDIYRRVVRVTREPDGKLAIEGSGPLVEHAVEMVRLPEDRMVDELLRRGAWDEVDRALFEIVERLARFHAEVPRADDLGTPEAVARRIRPVVAQAGKHLPPASLAAIRRFVEAGLAERHDLLARRAEAGFVREGHGDLHAANICLAPQGVRIYDRLEFDRALRCGDVAFDLSFLAMSLDVAGARDLGSRLRRLYAERTDDPDFDDLCAFFRVQRALVRANVTLLRGGAPERVRAYDRLALGYAIAPVAILLCGLPATGKSTRARELAQPLGAAIVATDRIRKKLLGLRPDEHWKGDYLGGPYRPEVTEEVYERLAQETRAMLAQGKSVIVDATLAKRAHRALLVDAVQGVPWVLVHLERDRATVDRYLSARAERPDISDAGREVYEAAAPSFEPPDEIGPEHRILDSGGEIIDRVLARLAGA